MMDQLLPSWAQPFGDPDAAFDYWELVCEVTSLRWGHDITFDFLAGTIVSADGRVAHIHNVARAAADQPLSARRRGIYEFLSLAEDAARESANLSDWTWVAPRLRRRLQQEWSPPWPLLCEPVDHRTNWIAAVETEAGCAPVATRWLESWGVGEDEVWERATKQAADPKQLQRHCLHDSDGSVLLLQGDMYTSGVAHDLTPHVAEPLSHLGALVIAPTAHTLYVLPVHSLEQARRQSLRLLVLATLRFDAEPNPVSTSLFYYRGAGQLEACMSYDDQGRIRVDVAEPLREALFAWAYPDVA